MSVRPILPAFSWVCTLQPDIDAAGQVCEFMPQERYARSTTTRLNKHGGGPFCRFRIPTSWTGEGVYLITRDGQPMYVGKCGNLGTRFNTGYGHISPKNCFVGGQSTNCKINGRVLQEMKAGNTLQLWFMATTDKDHLERELIHQYRPPWNGHGVN